jgi:hypothetical protein
MAAFRMFLVVLMLTATSSLVSGQDQIVKRNGDIIRGTVKEISTTEIKYVQDDLNKNVIFTIEKKVVDKIIFADGKEYKIDYLETSRETTEQNSSDLFLIQRKNAIKFDFIGPIFNTTSITYERSLRPGASAEFTAGAIGLGFAENRDKASGILLKGGYKFLRSPDHYIRGLRYAHILKGRYIKMEFNFASYRSDHYTWNSYTGGRMGRETTNKWAILMVLGSQAVFSNSFMIDTYLGLGMGKSNNNDIESLASHGFGAGNGEVPIAASAGIRIGFLFDTNTPK